MWQAKLANSTCLLRIMHGEFLRCHFSWAVVSECFNFEILYRPAFLVDSDTEHLKLWQEAFGGLEGTQLLRTFMYFLKMRFESVLPTLTLYTSVKTKIESDSELAFPPKLWFHQNTFQIVWVHGCSSCCYVSGDYFQNVKVFYESLHNFWRFIHFFKGAPTIQTFLQSCIV